MGTHTITNAEELRAVYRLPSDSAVKKVLTHLDKHCVNFINLSPICVLSTSGAKGSVDASPKGGDPGFVQVRDAKTLLLPDWPGNNRLDSLENIVGNPHIGMIFFVPGIDETLRINGRAVLSTDPSLRNDFSIDKKLPISVLIITVEESYLHCARAIWRADLWNSDNYVDRAVLPSMGLMLADQIKGYDGISADKRIANNRKKLYSLD